MKLECTKPLVLAKMLEAVESTGFTVPFVSAACVSLLFHTFSTAKVVGSYRRLSLS